MNPNIPPREVKDLHFGDDAQAVVMRGAEKMYNAVSAVYGPSSRNALLGMQFGDPTLTHDGVTVAKRVILPDRAENDVAQVLRQASDKTNKTAGDGTTATVVLAYHLLAAAHRQVMAAPVDKHAHEAMKIKRQLEADKIVASDFVKTISKKATTQQLLEVAVVSSGDQAIGEMVADTMDRVGLEGAITIREQSYPIIEPEFINGYYFNKGFMILNQKVIWEKPLIFVSQKRIAAAADIIPLIQLVMQQETKKVVIVGDVSGEALNILITNTLAQQDGNGRPWPFEGIVIPPIAFNDEAIPYVEDIATYVGAKPFMQSDEKPTKENFGTADRTEVTNDAAMIFGGNGDGHKIAERAAMIKAQIDDETNAHQKDRLEQRFAKLVGKIAIVNVGGSTPTEMEELRYRIEDAIEAVKSAMQDGIVPGGATTLVRVAALAQSDHGPVVPEGKAKDILEPAISSLMVEALHSTFRKLMENAGQSPDYRLTQVQKAKLGYGFNLRAITDEPIDLSKAGIWDATRVVVQIIENAISAAGALLTVGTIITPIEKDEVKK
jgi:chaperonin GroEL